MGSSVLLVFLIPILLPRIIKALITDGPELAEIFIGSAFEIIKNFDLNQFLSNLEESIPELIEALSKL